jgi:hypothetical protein
MSRHAYLALSAAVTAFVLVLIGGVTTYVLRSRSAPSLQASEGVPVAVVNAREAEYRRLIEEANARLRDRRTDRSAVSNAEGPMARVRSPDEREEGERASHEASRRGQAHREHDDD